METSLPTPMTARVYVNLLEGNFIFINEHMKPLDFGYPISQSQELGCDVD